MEKINIFAKINKQTKDRADLYVVQSKLLKKETDTLAKLIETAIDDYIIQNPL